MPEKKEITQEAWDAMKLERAKAAYILARQEYERIKGHKFAAFEEIGELNRIGLNVIAEAHMRELGYTIAPPPIPPIEQEVDRLTREFITRMTEVLRGAK